MSQSNHPVDGSMSREQRKQLLVLACETDRAAWSAACRPRPLPPAAMAGRVLHLLEPLLTLVPGLPGRWLRKMNFFANIGRLAGLFPS